MSVSNPVPVKVADPNKGHPLNSDKTLSRLLNLEELYFSGQVTAEVIGQLAVIYGVD